MILRLTDDERRELSDKVRERNEQSQKRPR